MQLRFFFHTLLVLGLCFWSHSPLGLGPTPGPLKVACTGAHPHPPPPLQPSLGPHRPISTAATICLSLPTFPLHMVPLFHTASALGLDRVSLPLLDHPRLWLPPSPCQSPSPVPLGCRVSGWGTESPDWGRRPGTEPGCLCPPPGHLSQPHGAASLLLLVPLPRSPSAPPPPHLPLTSPPLLPPEAAIGPAGLPSEVRAA